MVRPISLRGAAYNEQYTDGSILVEVGACGNTLAEAENAAVLLADTLAGIILSGKCKAAHGAVLPSHHLYGVFNNADYKNHKG